MSAAGGLPRDSFGQIAAILRASASSDAEGIELLETVWRGDEAVATRTIEDLRTSGRVLGELFHFFRAWAPHEAELREIIAALRNRREAATTLKAIGGRT